MTGGAKDDRWFSDELVRPDGSAWDLLVIGGGTAGLVAAMSAAGVGASVLLLESERTGGDCLWTGCVPSKALLSAAHAVADARASSQLGVTVGEVVVDFAAVMDHVRWAIATIEPVDSPAALRAAGVKVANTTGVLTGPHTAMADGVPIRFRQALLATGTQAAVPPIPGLAGAALTNDTIFSLSRLPARLLVLGGGSIGCELGQAFARLGSAVTIVEASPGLLPHEDVDAADVLTEALTEDGIDIRVSASLERVTPSGDGWAARLADGETIEVDDILVAIGRAPRTEELGLRVAGVDLNAEGFVRVNSRLQTSNPRIWAAGDVTGRPAFTHVAGVDGTLAAMNAVLGLRRTVDTATIPRVTFTQPEVAAMGVDLEQARRRGLTVRTVQHTDVDRAIAERRTEGFSRLVLDRRGRVVGATIVGRRAGESLAELVLAARHGLRGRDIAASMHAYPTYGDGGWKAGITHTRGQLSTPMMRVVIRYAAALRRRRLSRTPDD